MNFRKVDKKYRPIPFWSWNEKLDTAETKKQVGIMDDAGVGGYFMHARGGLLTEYMSDEWFENVKAACDEGHRRGMHPWAYDENGWPSGFGNLKVSGRGVEYQQKRLLVEPLTVENANAENTVTVKGGYRYYYEANPYYVDVLDKKVIRCFIDEIYEEYKRRMGNSFEGFFTDEPQILRGDGYPWSFPMIDTFRETYGYDLIEHINELFFDEGDYMQTRVDFWYLATKLFSENYFKQIYDWCNENGYGFTGHLICDDTLASALDGSGALLPHYEYMTIPGMDWLGRRIRDNVFTAIQLGSACAQLGKKQVLSETFALCGHNVSHTELKAIYEGQMVRGVNLLCTHLEGYSNRGIRKRDYPPAVYYQQPWWDDMKIFFDSMSRIGKILAEGKPTADTLVFMPQSSIWALYNGYNGAESKKMCDEFSYYHNTLMKTLGILDTKHILYHLGDEILMERHGKVVGNKLVIGEMEYSRLIIPDHLLMLPNTKRLFDEFERAGGVITSAEDIASNPITEPSMLLYTKRECEDFDVHYFVNSTEKSISATFSRGNYALDIETGDLKAFYGVHTFEPYESLLLIDTHDSRERMPMPEERTPLDLCGEWRVKSASYNSITLDRCDYSFDGECIAKDGYVLDILPRINELRRPVKLTHKFTFNVKELPKTVYLATETPEIFDITLNGARIDKTDLGYFRDISFRLLDIKDALRVGENELVFNSTICQSEKTYEHLSNSWAFETMRNSLSYDMEIEPVYIVGDFGAQISVSEELPREAYRITSDPVITAAPAVVDIERLDTSGYPEFAGELTLVREFDITDTKRTVRLSGRGLNSIHISVNGKEVAAKMFPPLCVDISDYLTEGKNTVELKILNNLRNMMGPHHLKEGESFYVGPGSFYRESNVFAHGAGADESNHSVLDQYNSDVCLVHFGITE